jgi:hypothetical protein
MDVVILNLELAAFDFRPGDAIQARIFNINNAPATEANQMVMLLELGVKARRRTGVASPGYQTERNECPQDAMHGHAGNLGQFGADRPVKLLGRGMIGSFLDCFKDSTPLYGNRQSAFAVRGEETLHSFLFFCPTHFGR